MNPYFYYPYDNFYRKYQIMPPVAPPTAVSPAAVVPPSMPPQTVPAMPTAPAPIPAQIPVSMPVQPVTPYYQCMPCNQFQAPVFPSPVQGMQDMQEMDNQSDYSGSSTSDPPPIITNPNPVPGTFLLKELTGYPNYGNPSGNADILYTGNRGVWTFSLPTWLPRPQSLRGQLLVSAALDDHANVPVSRYSLRIAINGPAVQQGAVTLQHGTPAGGRFTNWRVLTFDVPNLRINNRIVITNNSTAGANDWIAFDWMELRLFYR